MASKQPTTSKDGMTSALSSLAIETPKPTTSTSSSTTQSKPKPKKKTEPIADSWEDESLSEEDAAAEPASSSTPSSLTTPAVPPPTPASPLALDSSYEWDNLAAANQGPSGSGSGTPARRPEKTDAVARRMIAAGLGLKAPRQTEEQRAYQRSVREQEKRRREAQRAEEERLREAAERAKAAVWED
ncbi:hypothetical protein V8C44DRAFT_338963 [Trichoderma aethiopicum]